MEEEILHSILKEVNDFRAGENRALLGELESDFEPLQFVDLEEKDLDIGAVMNEEDHPPGTSSIPFVLLGKDPENPEELGVGFWEFNLN